jgi:hypothetical protein
MPTTILADEYNALRVVTNTVLGISDNASPSYGYGQGFSTNAVVGTRAVAAPADASKITAQGYEDLYIDLIRVRSHQIGAAAAIDAFVIGDYDTNGATTDKIEESYITGLVALGNNILTDRFLVDPGHLTIASLSAANSTRAYSTTWNGTISHIFKVVFNTELERRHFFNSGGEIRFSASVAYTGSQPKTVDWQSILNAMGSTSFKAESTSNNASVGTGTDIGNYDLTGSYQRVYSRDGGAVYANNEYRVSAINLSTSDTTSAIQFKVEFIDGSPNDPTYGIDEAVSGAFNSSVQIANPSSQISINGTTHNAVINNVVPVATVIRPLS